MKEPWLAVIWSGIFPGLGQFYSGRKTKGLIFLLVQAVLLIAGFGGLALLLSSESPNPATILRIVVLGPIVLLAVSVVNLFDAHKSAREYNGEHDIELPSRKKNPFLALFLSLLFPGVGHFYLKQILKGIFIISGLYAVRSFLPDSTFSASLFRLLALGALKIWVAVDSFGSASRLNEDGGRPSFVHLKGPLMVYLTASAVFISTVLIIHGFYLEAFRVPADSMLPTLSQGDHFLVNKAVYRKSNPRAGDIVAFMFPTEDRKNPHFNKMFVKRVIATEGQTVEIKDKEVFVDGERRSEPFVQFADKWVIPPLNKKAPPSGIQSAWEGGGIPDVMRDNFGPVVVPKGCIFVLGDNRDRSYDSRFWGPLPLKNVQGKAILVYYPISRFRKFTPARA